MRSAALSLLLLASLSSCTSRAPGGAVQPAAQPETEPDTARVPAPAPSADQAPPRAAEATPGSAAPFLLEWRRGSGALFRDEIAIRDDGRFSWVAQVITGNTGSMHAIDVQLSDAEVSAVRAAIEASNLFSLPEEPPTTTTPDGEQLSLGLRMGDRVHTIRAEEPLPAGVVRIQRAIGALFTEARQAQLRAAGPPQPSQLRLELLRD